MSGEVGDARKRLSEATTPTTPELTEALRALAVRVEAEGDIASRPGQMASLHAIAADIRALLSSTPRGESEREAARATCPGMGRTHIGTQYFDLCPRCSTTSPAPRTEAVEREALTELVRELTDQNLDLVEQLNGHRALAEEVRSEAFIADRPGQMQRLERIADALDALDAAAPRTEGQQEDDFLASDGQANDCRHTSATGIDTTPISDPNKVWRCDHCGLRWTTAPPSPAPRTEAVEREALAAVESFRSSALALVEHWHPHAADSHPEGTCETCDFAFAVDSDIRELRADPAPQEGGNENGSGA